MTLPESFHGLNLKDEQETTINILRTEDRAIIYTCDETMLTYIKKKFNEESGWKIDKLYYQNDMVHAISVSCPRKYIRFRG